MPAPRRAVSAPMFGEINTLDADKSTFNNTVGDQYNYNLSHTASCERAASYFVGLIHLLSIDFAVPAPHLAHLQSGVTSASVNARPAVPQPPVPQAASAPPPPVQPSFELTPAMAEARMFGTITRFQTEDSDFNNSVGTQINVHYGKAGRDSSTAFGFPKPPNGRPPNPVQPIFASPQLAQYSATDDQGPPKSHGLFKRKQHGDAAAPKSDKKDLAIGISDYVLTTLQSASRFSYIPFLPQAATAALSILQGVQVRVQLRSPFRDADICPCRVQGTIRVALLALQPTDAI
jgi:hypothetical protein